MNKLIVPIFFWLANLSVAAEVPKSPYIAIVYRYGDAMAKLARETHSAGQNDLRILYTLSQLSNKPIYRDAADAQLRWHLQQGIPAGRPWMLWDRCFQIAPEQSRDLASKSNSIRAFAAAYGQTKDDSFLKLIDSSLGNSAKPNATPIEQLSLAIDAWGASTNVPEPLATKLRRFAEAQDEAFLSRPAPLGKNLWQNSPNEKTTTALAMLCISRYDNTANIKYRDLIRSAADAYRSNPPPTDADISPQTFGHAISLQLAAWRCFAKQEYLDSARTLADIAVKKFRLDNQPLPQISTGTDTLVLSLLDLHLSILHITAVRCPPNTIDR